MSALSFFGEGLPYLDTSNCNGTLITIEGTDGVGRTTQMSMLREWLELQGYGVIETGWTRSQLVGETIAQAKSLRMLNKYTYALLYAADFADRLEKEIIPALKSGFVVLSDRYVFTAWARDTVRGVDPAWARDLYGFAPQPDLIIYLKLDLQTLVRRAVTRGSIDWFESGMDMALGDDLYDSFKRYQSRLLKEYSRMDQEFDFHTVSARGKPERIQGKIREVVSSFFTRHDPVGFQNIQPTDTESIQAP